MNSANKKINFNKIKIKISIFEIVCLIILLFYMFTLVISFGWGILNSFKGSFDYIENSLGIPKPFILNNYFDACEYFGVRVKAGAGIRYVQIPEQFLNTILYAVGGSLIQTLTCCIMAYATSKFNYKLSKIIYTIVIFTMILPIVGALPSEVQMLKNLGMYDTIIGTWVLKTNFLGIHYLVFYAAFKEIPKEFNEAAMIDGASNLDVMLYIMFPLVKFVFLTIIILKFIVDWNEFQIPLIYIPNHPTLSYGVYKFTISPNNAVSDTPHKLAGCMLIFVPIFILFICLHKRLIGNVSMGGVKG